MISEVGRWHIEHDPAATASCFVSAPPFDCSCVDCRNFLAALDSAFPIEFRTIAEQLGIDLHKPAELAHFGRETIGRHVVGGWFHVVGRIISGADARKSTGSRSFAFALFDLAPKFAVGFSEQLDLVGDSFNGRQLIQLEFCTRVPWVIEEPEPQ